MVRRAFDRTMLAAFQAGSEVGILNERWIVLNHTLLECGTSECGLIGQSARSSCGDSDDELV